MYVQNAYTETFRAGGRRGGFYEEATDRGSGTRRAQVRAAASGCDLPARDGRGDRRDRQGRQRGTHGYEEPHKQPVRGDGLSGQPEEGERPRDQSLPERLRGARAGGPRGHRLARADG